MDLTFVEQYSANHKGLLHCLGLYCLDGFCKQSHHELIILSYSESFKLYIAYIYF